MLTLQFEGYANNEFTCCSILKKDNAFVPSTSLKIFFKLQYNLSLNDKTNLYPHGRCLKSESGHDNRNLKIPTIALF